MSLKYADRMDNMKVSEISHLLKVAQDPKIISFAGGLPAPELFPTEKYEKIASTVMREDGERALQYGAAEGYKPLRDQIVKRMKKSQTEVSAEDILVTSGSQQGLDFAAKIYINPGDVIISESPSYLGAINAFNAYEPKFVEIGMDDEGMIMEDLEEALKTTDNVKFIYVIPDFQNPSGKTWSIERRKRLVELANEYDVVIVEDNPYGELRFEGDLLPSVKHFDTEGRVIFLGTFSKIFCPGLRLGWVAADEEILNKFSLCKQAADLQASSISQMEMAKFLEVHDIEKHIDILKSVYSKRKDLMIRTMEEEFPEEITYTNPEGGLFLWVELPEYMDSKELAAKALEKNVAYVPGISFYPNGGVHNTLRMNYSNMPEDKIVEGVKRLAAVFREELK